MPCGSTFMDDRIAVRWPAPLRPVVQAFHYRLDRIRVLECFPAAYVAHDTMALWPTHDDVLACRQGDAREQFLRCTKLSVDLAVDARRRVFEKVLTLQPNSCSIHRILRLSVDQLLGCPPSAAEARRRLTRTLALIHPDKMAALAGGDRSQVSEGICREAIACLLVVRAVLDDARYAQALFVSGRLQYGQFGSHVAGRLLAALCWLGALVGCRRRPAPWSGLPRRPWPPAARRPVVMLALPSSTPSLLGLAASRQGD